MNSARSRHKQPNGFTIVELITVLGIISILLSIAAFSFNNWQVKYNLEAQVRQMVTDFSELRIQAMTRKQRHSITLNADNYVLRSYSTEDESDTTGAVIPGGTRAVKYRLMQTATLPYDGETYEIDERGMLVALSATIYMDDRGSSASLNCISIHTVRVNPGWSQTVGGACNDR